MAIVDEDDAVTYEDIVFYLDTGAYEAMARDLASPADSCALLDFDEGSNPCVVADLTSVEIDKGAQADSLP